MATEIRSLLPYFVNFSIVVVLLVMMARKPLRKYVYQRHERMRDAFEAAAIAHQKAAKRAEAARLALAKVADEGRELANAEATATAAESREILEKARAEVLRVSQETERLARGEQDDASERVKGKFLDLVVQETEETLKRSLKKDDHSAIIKRAQNSIEVGA